MGRGQAPVEKRDVKAADVKAVRKRRPAIIKQLRSAGYTHFSILMTPDGSTRIDVGAGDKMPDNVMPLEAWRQKREGQA